MIYYRLKAAHANLQVAETYSLTAQFSGTTEGRGSLLEIFYTTKGQLAVAEQKYSAAIQIYEDVSAKNDYTRNFSTFLTQYRCWATNTFSLVRVTQSEY